ncbi:hypothetical protein F3Y22_tig00111002pilonHSYRG00006 [Hibiscus syriacus]|uniref:3-hydroxyacyl-CoA dehydrogenase NAD binding domain-containing protein n=1 Tax=Hibiscus syriacus TaxID=106335 RepID=A0A6A2Z7T5_HIBSY|nr:hypothetical protein F3Y22_tig00111002pilonHSYRG00006 [Hibiscus syriacus]
MIKPQEDLGSEDSEVSVLKSNEGLNQAEEEIIHGSVQTDLVLEMEFGNFEQGCKCLVYYTQLKITKGKNKAETLSTNGHCCRETQSDEDRAKAHLRTARQQAKKTAPNLPQHQICLDVIEEGIVHGGYSGVLKEAKVFKEIVLSDTARGLVHVFLAQQATSKVPVVTDVGLKPRQIKKVAIIGGGLMGFRIATALIMNNISVVLKEVNSEYLQKGIKTIEANVRGLATRGKLAKDRVEKALSMIKGVLDYAEFEDVDMVIEAVIENVGLKQKLFNEIEKACLLTALWQQTHPPLTSI